MRQGGPLLLKKSQRPGGAERYALGSTAAGSGHGVWAFVGTVKIWNYKNLEELILFTGKQKPLELGCQREQDVAWIMLPHWVR